MRQFDVEKLHVKIYRTRREMGQEAEKEAAACIKEMLETKESLNIIFAAAPSQNEFLEALREDKSIEWNRINAYHMDEYVGLKQGSPASFSGFLNDAVFERVPFKTVNCLNGQAPTAEGECERYTALLNENPVDIVFMGIGENGHIAFNDPGVADFNDEKMVKVVELDHKCRQQQVNDGCFPTLADVPTHAFTVTIPGLMRAKHLFCIVPNERKADAVEVTVDGPVAETCPASIMRTHESATLYLDADSAGKLV